MLSLNIALISPSSPDPYAMGIEQLAMFLEERAVPQQRPPLPLDDSELCNRVFYRIRQIPDHIIEQLMVPKIPHKDAIKNCTYISHCSTPWYLLYL